MISPLLKSFSLIALIACVLSSNLPTLHAKSTGTEQGTSYEDLGGGELEENWDDTLTCDTNGHALASKFTKLSNKLDLVDTDGELCSAEEYQQTKAENEVNIREHLKSAVLVGDQNITISSCDAIYGFIEQLLVDLDVTAYCCLTDNSTCTNNNTSTNIAKAYGYGFLMVTAVSLLSLLGLILLPFIRKNSKLAGIYVYINILLIALGTSAVFSGAILHLLPKVLGLDNNKDGYLIKGIVVSVGLYMLYLFEVVLHSCNAHHRGHHKRGTFHGIRPLAWIIICGDSIHNFADGLTLGAAISHSLSLGLSTTVAIVLHEIPHELGDYAILLSTGLSWYAALLLNFFSSLTAFIGFFVGVTIGTESAESNRWILTIAVGLFLYVALVDLLPELIHSSEKGFKRIVHVLLANIGFFISFTVLFLIALYEDDLNSLFQ